MSDAKEFTNEDSQNYDHFVFSCERLRGVRMIFLQHLPGQSSSLQNSESVTLSDSGSELLKPYPPNGGDLIWSECSIAQGKTATSKRQSNL
jgi:hypothetical protein